MTKRIKILLGQLNSNGDCLYATTVARQIKSDYPGCHLTWAIGSMCRSILDRNPYVDDVWEVPLTSMAQVRNVWPKFEIEAQLRHQRGDFDHIFLTQVAPGNLQNFDGMIRSSLFRGYPRPITEPITPVLRLTPAEIKNVEAFALEHNLSKKEHVILFECSPQSDQSFVTPDFALVVAEELVRKVDGLCVVLSSKQPVFSSNVNILDGSVLSFRENAELTKYCTLLIGASSGISWLCTSDWAKPLPMIQLINPRAQWFASFVHDYKHWGFPVDNIIELSTCKPEKLIDCVMCFFKHDFKSAKLRFHEEIPFSYEGFSIILEKILINGEFLNAYRFICMYLKKYGFTTNLFFKIGLCFFLFFAKSFRNGFSKLFHRISVP